MFFFISSLFSKHASYMVTNKERKFEFKIFNSFCEIVIVFPREVIWQ